MKMEQQISAFRVHLNPARPTTLPDSVAPERRRAAQLANTTAAAAAATPNEIRRTMPRNGSRRRERERKRGEEKRRRDDRPTNEVPHSEHSVIIVSFLSFISIRWKNDETTKLSVFFLCSEESVSPSASSICAFSSVAWVLALRKENMPSRWKWEGANTSG